MKFSKKSDLFGKELYSILVKDHIYFDGNKRLAAILFLEFLNRNHALFDEEKNMGLSNDALVAITLMIAESKIMKEINQLTNQYFKMDLLHTS